jgi:hypothetical protein
MRQCFEQERDGPVDVVEPVRSGGGGNRCTLTSGTSWDERDRGHVGQRAGFESATDATDAVQDMCAAMDV